MRCPAVLAAALALTGCAIGTTPLAPATVGPDYVTGSGAFNTGTRITARAATFERQGRVAVCAATAADGVTALAAPYLRTVLETGVVRLAGRNLLQGLAGFPRAASPAALSGAPAGCVLTGHAWRPEDAAARPRIDFPRLILERDDFGGYTVWFRGDRSGQR